MRFGENKGDSKLRQVHLAAASHSRPSHASATMIVPRREQAEVRRAQVLSRRSWPMIDVTRALFSKTAARSREGPCPATTTSARCTSARYSMRCVARMRDACRCAVSDASSRLSGSELVVSNQSHWDWVQAFKAAGFLGVANYILALSRRHSKGIGAHFPMAGSGCT